MPKLNYTHYFRQKNYTHYFVTRSCNVEIGDRSQIQFFMEEPHEINDFLTYVKKNFFDFLTAQTTDNCYSCDIHVTIGLIDMYN